MHTATGTPWIVLQAGRTIFRIAGRELLPTSRKVGTGYRPEASRRADLGIGPAGNPAEAAGRARPTNIKFLLDPGCRAGTRASAAGRRGQALVESCVVIIILCLLLMGFFQLSRFFMAQEILQYAAGRGARAKTVGFNDFMVYKVVRVGTIANAGRMTYPALEEQTPTELSLTLGTRFRTTFPNAVSGGPAAQREMEEARIPLYLGADWQIQLPAILDYENWGTVSSACVERESPPLLDFYVRQHFPISLPLFRLFYADDTLPLSGKVTIENHYPLYLDVE